MVLPLSNIEPGTAARIVCLANEGLMAGRLYDLGFEPGANVACVLRKKKRNIAAYLVRNAVIALREEDSRLIMVEEIEGRAISGAERPRRRGGSDSDREARLALSGADSPQEARP